jgi:hypothetical protein
VFKYEEWEVERRHKQRMTSSRALQVVFRGVERVAATKSGVLSELPAVASFAARLGALSASARTRFARTWERE